MFLYFDGNHLLKRANEEVCDKQTRIALKLLLETEPFADATEVVRCKDCKHRPRVMNSFGDLCEPVCDIGKRTCPALDHGFMGAIMPKDNFFCAFGEKKDD